jgi:hypothetical protein
MSDVLDYTLSSLTIMCVHRSGVSTNPYINILSARIMVHWDDANCAGGDGGV